MSTYETNKNLPQIKELSEFQKAKYKKICDELDELKPKITAAQDTLGELNRKQGLLYRKMEQMWIYRDRKARESIKQRDGVK